MSTLLAFIRFPSEQKLPSQSEERHSYNMPRVILPFSHCWRGKQRQRPARTPPLLRKIRPLGAAQARKQALRHGVRKRNGCRPASGLQRVNAMKRANVKQREMFDAAQTRLRLLLSALETGELGADDELESLDFTSIPSSSEEDSPGYTSPQDTKKKDS
jgi:hypothetical protein